MSPRPICAVELRVLGELLTGGIAFGLTEYMKNPSGASQSSLQNSILYFFVVSNTHFEVAFAVNHVFPLHFLSADKNVSIFIKRKFTSYDSLPISTGVYDDSRTVTKKQGQSDQDTNN